VPKRLLFNAFTMNCVSHIQHGLWVRDDTRQLDYTSLDPWVELARLLERGRFDALFLADVIGVYDHYRGGPETSLVEAMQIPVNDPALLIPAMAHATTDLGFAFTSSVLQTHPFTFARQASTLDHLTGGRLAWNIVTSYLPNAGANLGYGGLPEHDERYDRAEEYLEVVYKLWEGSWEDDAVVRDRRRRMYADPAKVHAIDHMGRFYQVAGPHLSEPSPQRTPLLFQAGSSERGRDFAASHAECIFLVAGRRGRASAGAIGADVRRRALARGRSPEDILVFVGISPVVGGTEEEAKRKAAEYREQLSAEGALAHMSGNIGIDLGEMDPDRPLASFNSNAVKGVVKTLVDSAPDKSWTFGDLIRRRTVGNYLAGTPEQIADDLAAWGEAGVDGFNITYSVTPGTFADFVDGVVPVLQARGLMQRDYSPGPLRQKLFGAPRLPGRHPAAHHRRSPSPAPPVPSNGPPA
jgi:FMN-dependent oxidoreductase (nitrilotriacetate monooxygenase family)